MISSSKALPKLSTTAKTQAQSLRVGIVASRFNEALTERLVAAARKELNACGIPAASIEVIRVPGAVEIPWALQLLAEEKRYNFLVALGVVIKGETAHFDYVLKMATEGIGAVMLRYQMPIGFGVLTLADPAQAPSRITIANGAVRAGLELALIKKERALVSAATHTVSGSIVRGERLASRMGFPTINIAYEKPSALPERGVYAGMLRYNGQHYHGVIALGPAASTKKDKLEIHCFANVPLDETIKKVQCLFIHKVSDFVTGNTAEMKRKIAADVEKAKKALNFNSFLA